MNYELAKELKDAGFRQKDENCYNNRLSNPVYAPTLSELIEACGEKIAVFQDGTMWTAGKINTITTNGLMFFDAIFSCTVLASTPEEAVARLWLALNKK